MKILICDDDQVYVDEITEMVEKFTSEEENIMIKGLSDERKIRNEIKINSYDLAILDIELGNLNGVDVARKLIQSNSVCLIVFISNYTHYVQDALILNDVRVNVFQYLFKPLEPELFEKTFYRGFRKYQHLNRLVEFNTSKGKIECTPYNVMYLETHYTELKIATEKHTYVSNIKNYKDCKKALAGYSFIKTHQSYYVNLRYVSSVQKDAIVLYNNAVLPISIAKYHIIKEAFHNYLLTGGMDDDDDFNNNNNN